jgi:general secretion pathway protein E
MTDLAESPPSPVSPGSAADPLEALCGVLLARGLIDDKTLERARRVAGETGQRLDAVLTQLGLVSERGLAEAFSVYLGLPMVTADRYPDVPLLVERLKARFLRKAHALPIAIEPDRLILAMADPLDPFTRSAVAAATGRAVAEDAERLKDLASEAPVIRLVNQIIARAVETQASDIHIEPFEDRLRVRYRYDGVLHEAESPPTRLTAAITSRIKIMARLDIAERRLPQDGRIKLAVRGQEVDFRVSTMPSLYGETVVLRVLDRTAVAFDYAKLGLPPALTANSAAALDLPNGIVLVTGPTGSGKTTTLYTGLLRSTRSRARSSRSRTRSSTS